MYHTDFLRLQQIRNNCFWWSIKDTATVFQLKNLLPGSGSAWTGRKESTHMSFKLKVCFIFLTESMTFTSLQETPWFPDSRNEWCHAWRPKHVRYQHPEIRPQNLPQTQECCQKVRGKDDPQPTTVNASVPSQSCSVKTGSNPGRKGTFFLEHTISLLMYSQLDYCDALSTVTNQHGAVYPQFTQSWFSYFHTSEHKSSEHKSSSLLDTQYFVCHVIQPFFFFFFTFAFSTMKRNLRPFWFH